MFFSKYDRRHWGLTLAALALTIPFGLFVSYASRTNLLGDNVWLTYGVFLALGAGVWALTILWWRSLDDVHRHGQMASWYWGSLFGGFAFLLWIIANNDHHTPYSEGAFHMFVAQFVLGLVLYGVWRLRGSAFGQGSSE